MPLTILLSSLLSSALAGPVLKPSPLSEEAYAETYTAVTSLNDGGFVLLQFVFTNAGIGDQRAACRALWVPPGESGINEGENTDRSGWSYNASTDALTVGNCQLGTTESGMRFSAALSDLNITLDIQASPNQVKPPNSRIEAGGGFYESDLVVPWAKAQATITAGSRSTSQAGFVLIDHSRSNNLLPKVTNCWLRFRGFTGSTPTLVHVRVPPNGGMDGWVWPLSEAQPTGAGNIDLQITDSVNAIVVSYGSDTITVSPTSQIYQYRPTESYGALGRLASPWIGNPTTTTYHARATTADGGTVSGILEVSEINDGGCAAQ